MKPMLFLLILLLLTACGTVCNQTFTYESGVLGTKFSIQAPEAWQISSWNKSSPVFPLLIASQPYLQSHFEISRGTVHPSTWREFYAAIGEPMSMQHAMWEQPQTPSSVFETASGLTAVEYRHGSSAVFILREDGRDYREIEGTQFFYTVLLYADEPIFDEFYDTARTVLDSLEFHDNPSISLEVSETGRSLGISQQNYPRIEGSTSALPLIGQILRAMFVPENEWQSPYEPTIAARTIPSYELLLAGSVDLIITPDPSAHILQLAESQLEFTPVAMEALVFITQEDNPVSSITTEQVLDIYANRTITNWSQLGGPEGKIIPLNRNQHSGSQTQMDNQVLKGREIHPGLEPYQIGTMLDVITAIRYPEIMTRHWNNPPVQGDFALGYTVYFYLDPNWPIKTLSLDGITPSRETILSGEYPLSTNYYAVVRADTPEDHPARLIAEWLTTPEGQKAVKTVGLGTLH